MNERENISEDQEFIMEYEQLKQDSIQISKRIEILSSELEELQAKQKQNYEAFKDRHPEVYKRTYPYQTIRDKVNFTYNLKGYEKELRKKEFSFDLKIVFLETKEPHYFENVVKAHFESQGFTVKKNTSQTGNKGIPDFLVSKGQESFYVEAKQYNDSLRIDQIKWFSQHPEKSVLVIEEYLGRRNAQTQKIIEREMFEIRKGKSYESLSKYPKRVQELNKANFDSYWKAQEPEP